MLPPLEAQLIEAAKQGDAAQVRQALAAGAAVDAVTPEGHHALLYAASQGHRAVVQQLLHSGANLGIETPGIGTALDAAIRAHQPEVIDLLRAWVAPETGLASARGMGSRDVNEWALLVQGSIAEAAEAFQRLTQARLWQPDVQGQDVIATDECYLAWQLRGHPWSLLQYLYRDFWQPGGMSDELAAALSRALHTAVIYYANSATAGAISYTLFEHGVATESFEYGSDDFAPGEAAAEERADDAALERQPLHFFSARRQVHTSQIDDPHDFVEAFLRDMDAYVPGWSERARRVAPGQVTRPLQAWRQETFVRVDFVAVR